MGDDRPNVYEEEGVWVYRASAAGRCERELWAYRTGMTPTAHPDWLLKAFQEGHDNEDAILKVVGGVTMAQRVIEIPVGKGVMFRGAIDGYQESSKKLVDAKAFAESTYYTKWLKTGIRGFPGYTAQMRLYGAGLELQGLELNGLIMAIGIKDDDGVVQKVKQFQYSFDDLPVTLRDLKRKVMRIEAAAVSGEMPPCVEPLQYPCSFFFIHDEKEIMVSDNEFLELMANKWRAAKVREDAAKKDRDEAGAMILSTLDEMEREKGEAVQVGDWVVSDVNQTNKGRVNWKKMADDGNAVDGYRAKETKVRYATVKEAKT